MKKSALLIISILILWGCATFSHSYKQGTEAAFNKDWDEAVKHYQKAVTENPKNSVYRLALIRAQVAASYTHLFKARNLASLGNKKEALVEYELALSYDPFNRGISNEMKRLTEEEEKEIEPEEVIVEPPIRLQVSAGKMDLRFPVEASLRSIFQALGKHENINIIFDEQFRDIPFSIELADMDFIQAMNTLCMASKNFYRIIDEKTIVIVPDQPVKRAQYELNAIKTFYLSNINAQDLQVTLQQMLRTQFKAPTIIVDKNLNSITVRDVPQVLELAEKIIRLWDKPKGEIVIDLEIMEASRIKLQELGVDFDMHFLGVQYNNTDTSSWQNLKDIDFTKTENFQITLPTAFLQFLESDSDTRIIAQPRLRGIEGEEITYMVGDEIPIPQTIIAPIAAGGIPQQPMTSYTFKNVGIDVKITPRIHFEREVTLEIDIKIKSLSGTGFADIPIISTREVKNVIRLKEGETNLLAGLLKDEERKTVKGIIGLKSIPVLGSLFSSTEKVIQQTDVIMTITPYIIRMLPLTKKDAEPLWVNLGTTTQTGSRAAQTRPEAELLDLELSQRRRLQEDLVRQQASRRALLSLVPSNFEVPEKREFRMNLNIRTEDEIGNFSSDISFNASILELKQVAVGGFVQQPGKEPSFLKNIDNSSGICTIGFTSLDMAKGYKGAGRVATLVFIAKAKGESTVSIANIVANSPTGQALSFNTQEARVRVR